jgi:hypothetical protein
VLEKANINADMTSDISTREWGHLQESGILMDNGDLITEGRVLEVAREIRKRWYAKDCKGIMEIMANNAGLNDDEYTKLHSIVLTESGRVLLHILSDASDFI